MGGFWGAVFKPARRPKTAPTENRPQKQPLSKTFDRFTVHRPLDYARVGLRITKKLTINFKQAQLQS